MAELKHISDIEQITEIQENDSLIGERDGRAVRIPVDSVGGLPKGEAPNQQLVTDAEGNTTWEDKMCYEYTGEVAIIPETTFVNEEIFGGSSGYIFENPNHMVLENGKTYIVTFDGTVYEVVPVELDGGLGISIESQAGQIGITVIPDVDGVDPNVIGKIAVFSPDVIGNQHTIKFTTGTVIKKIDSKYLPIPDMAESDPEAPGYIKNRIAYVEEERVKVFQGDVITNNYLGGLYCSDFHDFYLKLDTMYEIELLYNGETYSMTQRSHKGEGDLADLTIDTSLDDCVIAYLECWEDKGTRIAGFTDQNNPPVITITEVTENVKTVDSKFLPTTVPQVKTAQVGQTVVVKAVDENGKPTEWEAKDASGSAGVFRVTLVAEYNGMEEVLVPDKTFREILDAVNAGMLPVVVCREINSDGSIYLGTMYYLNYIDSNAYADFNALSGGNKFRCTVNNEWTV